MITLSRTEPKDTQPTIEEQVKELATQVKELTKQVEDITSEVANLKALLQAQPL